jgi:hypothetical protein
LVVARLNKVGVGVPPDGFLTKTFRKAETIIVETSNSPGYYNHVIQAGMSIDGVTDFAGAQEARYAKLTIIANYDNPEASPIGVYK